MTCYNQMHIRQGEIGRRRLRLYEDGSPADLSDASTVQFFVETETYDGLYVQADCSVESDPKDGIISFGLDGSEFSTLEFSDLTEMRLRALVWATYADGSKRAFPHREGAIAIVSANLPARESE